MIVMRELAGGPAFKLQKPPQSRGPRSSRTRRARTTTACTTGGVERTKFAPAASPPTLAKTQGWGTLRGNGAMQRGATLCFSVRICHSGVRKRTARTNLSHIKSFTMWRLVIGKRDAGYLGRRVRTCHSFAI